jgi:hypothetical protein
MRKGLVFVAVGGVFLLGIFIGFVGGSTYEKLWLRSLLETSFKNPDILPMNPDQPHTDLSGMENYWKEKTSSEEPFSQWGN